jgi:hypothetical protein
MKRVAVGALFLSLAAASLATAGNGYSGYVATHPNEFRADDRRHDNGDDHSGDRRDRDRDNGRHFDRDDRQHNWRDDHRDNRRDDRRHDGRDNSRDDRRDHWRDDRRDNWRDDHRRFDRGWPRYDRDRGFRDDWRRDRYHYGEYQRPWGYYDHQWRRGDRLPRSYYARPYVIGDYEGCGLRSPPYGHHWVRVNRDAVLAVIASGVVLDVMYNQFY